MEFKSFRFKADDVTEDGIFTGYASTFNEKDLGGDIVVPGAFDQWLGLWKSNAAATPPILDNHDANKVLGIYLEITPDNKGLWVKGQLNQETVSGKEKRALMKQGAITGLSIGYNIYPGGYRWDASQKAYMLTDIELWEISLATFPMNTSARVDTVKTAFSRGSRPTIRDVERALREQGFSQGDAKAIAGLASGTLGLSGDESHRDGGFSEQDETAIKAALDRAITGA
jgi:HK97 family phage prohead protease